MALANSNSRANIITVPTKQHDGGSNRASTANFSTAPTPKVDAFAKYSSNLIRMKALLLLDEDDGNDNLDYLGSLNDALRHASAGDHVAQNNHGDGDASKRRKGNNSQPITQQGVLDRKTKVSFELHPSLLLYDLLDLNVSARIPDDEDESKE